MGNNDYNCLSCHTKGSNGEYLRPHTGEKKKNLMAAWDQFECHQEEWSNWSDSGEGSGITSWHYLQEEAAAEVLNALLKFFNKIE